MSEVSAKEPIAKVDVWDVKNDNAHTVDLETVDAIPKVVIDDDSKDEIAIIHALAVVKNSPFLDLTQDEIKVLGHFSMENNFQRGLFFQWTFSKEDIFREDIFQRRNFLEKTFPRMVVFQGTSF